MLNRNRTGKAILFTFLWFGLFACSTAQIENNPTETRLPLSTESPQDRQIPTAYDDHLEVLSTTLQDQYASLNADQLVLFDTTYIPEDQEQLDADMAYVQQELEGSIDEATIQAFLQDNRASHPLENIPNINIPIHLISEEQFSEFFEGTGEAGWDAFFEAYPGSPGVTRVSQAGIDPDGTQALIYIEDWAAQDSAQGLYIHLVKSGYTWKVDRTLVAWVS